MLVPEPSSDTRNHVEKMVTLTLDLNLATHFESSAKFSDDGLYRWELTRRWGTGPALMFVSLNPSTADGRHDDQTIRRDKCFARRLGYSAFHALNLYGWRATDPGELAGVEDPIGPENDAYLDRAAAQHDLIVFAWGAKADATRARAVATRLWGICRETGGAVACFGWTVEGQPRHPSRLAKDTPLSTLTANAHPDFIDVDPRWTQLLADTNVLDSCDTGDNQCRKLGGDTAIEGGGADGVQRAGVLARGSWRPG